MLSLLMRRDTLGGLTLIALGGFAVWQSSQYALGGLHRMGPGFVPMVISALILGCGIILLVGSLIAEDVLAERPNLRATAAVIGAIIIFALTLETLGLIVATLGLVLAVNMSGKPLAWLPLANLCVALFLIVYCLFVLGLGMPIPLRPS